MNEFLRWDGPNQFVRRIATAPIELEGARIFFPEERADMFNQLLRKHLQSQ